MKTVRRPPYPKWNPGYFPCSSLTPLPLSSRRPSVSFGGFGLRWIGVRQTDYSQVVAGREKARVAAPPTSLEPEQLPGPTKPASCKDGPIIRRRC